MTTTFASASELNERHNLPFFFRSATHEEATARLLFLIEQRKQLGLLLGAPGSGRSMTLQQVANDVVGTQVALIQSRGWGPDELLRNLADALKTRTRSGESPRSLWQRIVERVNENNYIGCPTVVLCDDAHLVDFSALEIWHKWLQATASPESALTIVLALPESHIAWLGYDLLERVDLRVNLQPWEPSDVQAFVEQQKSLLAFDIPEFERQAIARICERSGGSARRVVRLVYGASQLCRTERGNRVGEDLVDRVAL